MKSALARGVLARRLVQDAIRYRSRHLAKGTAIDVLRQRKNDSLVEIRLLADDDRVYLVPADAIDAATARVMSIHRPPRHRRWSGATLLPVDWKPSQD